MFIAKPVAAGQPAVLDGSGKDIEVLDLTQANSAKLLQAQDFGEFGNPDGAQGSLDAQPTIAQGNPQGDMRSENVSGRGNIQKTAKTSAPMSMPFPAPTSTVRTNPSSIKV